MEAFVLRRGDNGQIAQKEHQTNPEARSRGSDDRAVDGGAPEAIGAEVVDGPLREQQRERPRVVLETREQQRRAAVCVQVDEKCT